MLISHFLFCFPLFKIKDHDCESGIDSTRRKEKEESGNEQNWINMRRILKMSIPFLLIKKIKRVLSFSF